MMNTNMINPASYYNPFAKYNYTSKTRGVYVPRESEPLLKASNNTEKSSNIFSENYDAQADLNQCMSASANDNGLSGKLAGFIDKFLNSPRQFRDKE